MLKSYLTLSSNDFNTYIYKQILIMEYMSKTRKSLETIKGRDISRRPKPMVAKAGATRKRTPYKDGGKV